MLRWCVEEVLLKSSSLFPSSTLVPRYRMEPCRHSSSTEERSLNNDYHHYNVESFGWNGDLAPILTWPFTEHGVIDADVPIAEGPAVLIGQDCMLTPMNLVRTVAFIMSAKAVVPKLKHLGTRTFARINDWAITTLAINPICHFHHRQCCITARCWPGVFDRQQEEP